jgi:hypothetical protein
MAARAPRICFKGCAILFGVEAMTKTTKQVSSFRQIVAAIDHFHKRNYECAVTLAAAGEGQVKEATTTHFFRVIRSKFSATDANFVINWLKHSSGPDEIEITEQECVVTIVRGIQKYVGTYATMHPSFQTFSDWAIDKGYTKNQLAVKAK